MELIDGVDFLEHVRGDASIRDAPTLVRRTQRPPAGEQAPSATSPGPAPAIVPFDETRLRDGLRQLFAALAFLHAAGKVHRDIKPATSSSTRTVVSCCSTSASPQTCSASRDRRSRTDRRHAALHGARASARRRRSARRPMAIRSGGMVLRSVIGAPPIDGFTGTREIVGKQRLAPIPSGARRFVHPRRSRRAVLRLLDLGSPRRGSGSEGSPRSGGAEASRPTIDEFVGRAPRARGVADRDEVSAPERATASGPR